MKWSVRTVVFMGLLVSINIVLTRFLGFMIMGNTIRISFGSVPIMLAGILFGPLAGTITGIASDLIGVMLNSMGGGYFPGFTISAALVGLIPGLLFLKYKRDNFSMLKIILSVLIVGIFVHLFLNTSWVVMIIQKELTIQTFVESFLGLLPPRLIARLIMIPLEIIFLTIILRAYNTYKSKSF